MHVLLLLLRLPEKLFTSYRIRKVRDSASWLIPLWVSIWVLLTSAIYLWMSYQAVGKRRESLASMCDERARMLQEQLSVSMNHLKALAMLVSTLHHSKRPSAIDQKTFARYAERTAFERPVTSRVAYGVRVTHAEREQFERQQGWSIKKMQSQEEGKAEVREPAEEYAPVIFAQDAIKHAISFDLLSGADDRDNVLRARESGKGVLTAPFKLPNNRLGVISTYAVYKYELPPNAWPHERIRAVIGYLGGIFDIEALVDKLLRQLAGRQSIVVKVYDTTNARPIIMYGSNDTGRGMLNVRTLNFGDPSRKHEMHCRFIQSPPWPWMAITTSIATLVIALLIGCIVYATAKRIARIEDDFQEMSVLTKRAEDADIAKSQFLATVFHEMRTPMNCVLGMLEMLMDTNLDKTQQYCVRTGKDLVSLTNDVLDQANIESGKLELEAVPFDLRTVCDDIVSLFCGKAQEKGLEIRSLGGVHGSLLPHRAAGATSNPHRAAGLESNHFEYEIGSWLPPQAMPLELLRQITNNFSERLGRGTFGTVYKVGFRDNSNLSCALLIHHQLHKGVLNNGKEVAVKLLHSMPERLEFEEEEFWKELENLRRLNHPNIVQLLGYCYGIEQECVEHNGRFVVADKITRALCLEYMHNTSLQRYLDDESVDWQTRYKIILGTCEGLQYLHKGLENSMLHLDIKPSNILLDQNMVPKLADFGLSKLIYDSKTQTASKFIGTRRYCPPEHFKGLQFSRKFDIFSLGVVMIEIIAGSEGYNKTADEMPSHGFLDDVQENWIKRIHQATTDCASPKCGCRQVKTCIEIALECVHPERMQRPNIEDIFSRLNETEHNTEKSATTASSQNEK